MVERLTEDLNCALDRNCYFSALSLALTLPDICGKAAYPNEKSGKARYIHWYDEHIGQYEICPPDGSGDKEKMPYLSGEVVYQLRCMLLHQGTPNIDAARIHAEENKIDHFELVVEKKKEYNALVDSGSVSTYVNTGEKTRIYRVNVRRLCFIISRTVQEYYSKNKEKFDFMNCTVVDLDEEFEKMHTMNLFTE